MRVRQETVELHPTVVNSIKQHARDQAGKGGREAVGFVAADQGQELGVAYAPMHNHAPNPQEAFFVEPWEQFKVEQTLAKEGYKIMGVAHSHPNSEALPSMSDHKLARSGEYVFIYSVVFDDLKAYKEVDGILEPVDFVGGKP